MERLVTQIQVSDCIIVGDSNFCDINWQEIESHSPSSRLLSHCLQDNYLTQLVKEPTRKRYKNDLVITGNESLIDSVAVSDDFPYTDIDYERKIVYSKSKQKAT